MKFNTWIWPLFGENGITKLLRGARSVMRALRGLIEISQATCVSHAGKVKLYFTLKVIEIIANQK